MPPEHLALDKDPNDLLRLQYYDQRRLKLLICYSGPINYVPRKLHMIEVDPTPIEEENKRMFLPLPFP